MTLEELVTTFPERAFTLRYVARGDGEQRQFIWRASWSSDYYTTDTDRLVDNHREPRSDPGFGKTPAEAVDHLLAQMLQSAKASVVHSEKRLREEKDELEALLNKVPSD